MIEHAGVSGAELPDAWVMTVSALDVMRGEQTS